jgi:formylglycine-generating enzyme required for sulfatase activity
MVLRGGAWLEEAEYARVSYRTRVRPDGFLDYVGLRVVVAPISL